MSNHAHGRPIERPRWHRHLRIITQNTPWGRVRSPASEDEPLTASQQFAWRMFLILLVAAGFFAIALLTR